MEKKLPPVVPYSKGDLKIITLDPYEDNPIPVEVSKAEYNSWRIFTAVAFGVSSFIFFTGFQYFVALLADKFDDSNEESKAKKGVKDATSDLINPKSSWISPITIFTDLVAVYFAYKISPEYLQRSVKVDNGIFRPLSEFTTKEKLSLCYKNALRVSIPILYYPMFLTFVYGSSVMAYYWIRYDFPVDENGEPLKLPSFSPDKNSDTSTPNANSNSTPNPTPNSKELDLSTQLKRTAMAIPAILFGSMLVGALASILVTPLYAPLGIPTMMGTSYITLNRGSKMIMKNLKKN